MAKGMCFRLVCLAALLVSAVGQTIRLVSPLNNGVGRLEVYYNGSWGTVCDDFFGQEEANVACRQLGRYETGMTPKWIDEFAFGSGIIWLDDLECIGDESSLSRCSHADWGDHNCEHFEDVGIICDENEVTIKLTPGYGKGLLQVYHSGRWGTVCDDNFGQVEASVVCRRLGYQGGKVYDISSTIPMWLDDVKCTMLNTDLKDCKHRQWGEDNCNSNEAVGVECFSFAYESTAARLVSTTNTTGEGVLELYYEGQWGRVCSTRFGVEEATVACRMLGHKTIGASFTHHTKTSTPPVILDKVQCLGTELSFNECLHYPWEEVVDCSTVAEIRCPSAALHLEPRGHVLNVLVGQVISVVCVVDSFNSPVTSFRWTHNGRIYSGQTFSKTVTSKSDSGTLKCSAGNVFASTQISVLYPPTVHLEPGNDTLDVSVGEDLRVECVVNDANPSVHTFRWSHNGQKSNGSTFLKRNITHSDGGKLTCTADNGHMMTPGRAVAHINVLLHDSSLIRSDDTENKNQLTAIVTGSVGMVTIIILIVVIIHLRRSLHAAKLGHKPNKRPNRARRSEHQRQQEVGQASIGLYDQGIYLR